jgi:hypothetical protein
LQLVSDRCGALPDPELLRILFWVFALYAESDIRLVDEFFADESLLEFCDGTTFGCRLEIVFFVAIMFSFATEAHVDQILRHAMLTIVYEIMDDCDELDERFLGAVLAGIARLGELIVRNSNAIHQLQEAAPDLISAEVFIERFESLDVPMATEIAQTYPFLFSPEEYEE